MNQSITADHRTDKHGEVHSEHDSRLQHHFATFEQQLDASKIGMWLFLATEVLLFGGLFVGFALQQASHPDAFLAAHHHLDKTLGALNTVVLLFSSFTMVMAVHSGHTYKLTPELDQFYENGQRMPDGQRLESIPLRDIFSRRGIAMLRFPTPGL